MSDHYEPRPSNLRRELADRVQDGLDRLDWTQKRLSQLVGFSEKHVSQMMNGHSGTLDAWDALLKAVAPDEVAEPEPSDDRDGGDVAGIEEREYAEAIDLHIGDRVSIGRRYVTTHACVEVERKHMTTLLDRTEKAEEVRAFHEANATFFRERAERAEAEVAALRIDLRHAQAEVLTWKRTAQELSDELDSSRKGLTDKITDLQSEIDNEWRPGVAMRELKIARLTNEVTDLNYTVDREAQERQDAEAEQERWHRKTLAFEEAFSEKHDQLAAAEKDASILRQQIEGWKQCCANHEGEIVNEHFDLMLRLYALADEWAKEPYKDFGNDSMSSGYDMALERAEDNVRALIAELDTKGAFTSPPFCYRLPDGWCCARSALHDGPCVARKIEWGPLGDFYEDDEPIEDANREVERLRAAQSFRDAEWQGVNYNAQLLGPDGQQVSTTWTDTIWGAKRWAKKQARKHMRRVARHEFEVRP